MAGAVMVQYPKGVPVLRQYRQYQLCRQGTFKEKVQRPSQSNYITKYYGLFVCSQKAGDKTAT